MHVCGGGGGGGGGGDRICSFSRRGITQGVQWRRAKRRCCAAALGGVEVEGGRGGSSGVLGRASSLRPALCALPFPCGLALPDSPWPSPPPCLPGTLHPLLHPSRGLEELKREEEEATAGSGRAVLSLYPEAPNKIIQLSRARLDRSSAKSPGASSPPTCAEKR